MKKVIFTILGLSLLFASCEKNPLPQLEQNPYRKIVEYTPGTSTMEVPGTLTADETYDWITMTQSGNTASFTLKRNTTGCVRTAIYSISGSKEKAYVFQKDHALDAKVTAEIASQASTSVKVKVGFKTDYYDDYAGWGLAYAKENNIASAKIVPQSGVPALKGNIGEITGLESGADYFVWAYVQSTEKDNVFGDVVPLIAPICVKEGEDIQAAISKAKEYGEVRVIGGATFPGGYTIFDADKNKKVSGGWNADFSEQSWDRLTIIDGGAKRMGFFIASASDDGLLNGTADISYFEFKNCNCGGMRGSCIHASGGPIYIHHCYMHDNTQGRGVINMHMDNMSTTHVIYNCKIINNVAAGHGGAIAVEDGNTRTDRTKVTLINNLIEGNYALKQGGGFAAGLYVYNNSECVAINNTFVANRSYTNGGGDYGMACIDGRGDSRVLFANNIVVGNENAKYPAAGEEPVYFRGQFQLGTGTCRGTYAYNLVEADIQNPGNATLIENIIKPYNFDYSSVLSDTRMPLGDAKGHGTLGTLSYTSSPDYPSCSLNLEELFEKYNTDLAGNPRVVNGKIDCGCYQSQ